MSTRHITVDTGLGPVTVVAQDAAVTGLYYRHHIRRPSPDTFGPPSRPAADTLLSEAAGQLRAYLAGQRPAFDLPLAASGSAFQQAVWNLVADIPRGTTTTYGAIAGQLGDRTLAYRVGQAVGANPLCILVPCHRVVGADGSLTGYAGGLRRKRALLELEEPAQVGAGRLF